MIRFFKVRKINFTRDAMKAMSFNPERIMRNTFEKMIRAAGFNLDRAWIAWRMFHLSKDRDAAARARKKVSAANLANVVDKKKCNHLRSGLKSLADGIAYTNAQRKVINRLHFVAFGKLKQAFNNWKEELD
jgi:hypothetical protein